MCTADIRQWYMQNGLQLNPDKSAALVIRTVKQLQVAASPVTIAGVDLTVAEETKVLGVTLDRRLSFDKHTSAMMQSCTYHAQANSYVICC